MKYTSHIRSLVILLAVSVIFLLCSTSTLQAATMPEYERLDPITTALNAPTAVAIDVLENIYVTESRNNRLLVYSHSGRYLKTVAGLDKPIAVAVSDDGRIFIANAGRGNVEVYNFDSDLLYKLGLGDGEFTQPIAIVIDRAGNVYVADSKEDRIKVYNLDGSYKFSFGTTGNGDGQFNFPTSISLDEPSGEIIISDLPAVPSGTGAMIQVFDMNGRFKRSFGAFGQGEGELIKPLGVAVDEDGRIYVTDTYQNVVQVFDRSGAFLGTIYDPENPMRTPLGIAFSKKTSRLFIVSLNTLKVEVYGIDGHIITVSAGSGGAISPSGTVFVKHGGNQTFTITPDENHQAAGVEVDGSSVGTVTAYTFTNVGLDHTIEATFTQLVSESTINDDDDIQANVSGPLSGFNSMVYLLKYLFVAGSLIVTVVVAMAVIKRRKK